MSDLTTPLKWTSADRAAPAGDADAGIQPFRWPGPPLDGYPDDIEPTPSMPCEFVGLNGKRVTARLIFFVPDERVAHVQLPPARTTMALRFGQFQSLTLDEPLMPLAPHAGAQSRSRYRIRTKHGLELQGETLGHVDSPHGVFLFPPHGDGGAVRRMFVPHDAYDGFKIVRAAGGDAAQTASAETIPAALAPAETGAPLGTAPSGGTPKPANLLRGRPVESPEQLTVAIAQQARMPLIRIGEALQSLGMVTQEQLDEALAQQRTDRGTPLGELLVRTGAVSREDLQLALASKMGYPVVNLHKFAPQAEALRKLPFAIALRLRLMPLMLHEGRLVVALDDPSRRRAAVDEVEFVSQQKTVPVLAQCVAIEEILRAAYEKIGGAGSSFRAGGGTPSASIESDMIATEKLVETLEKEGLDQGRQEDDRQIEQSDNSLVRLLNNMIIEAHADGVSDIHIESYPGRYKIKIRFRKDGQLHTHLELPHTYRNALIARVKIMCDLDISERRKPQDGKINFARFSPQHRIELRVATIPTNNGLEDVVMRILASAKPIPVDQLGLSPANLEALKTAMERPYGLVLCVGPTGSGKTTTLHSALSYINVPERKIWTAEDPVEITQPGLRQVQVNPKIDWTFAKALRAFLRADPDVIMVGEIRDGETAQMAVEASLTGHLVLSTLHTNSAAETVTRLLDMGMDPFNFADSLLAVLAQRLVRRLCTRCRVSQPARDEQVSELLDDYLHACPKDEPRFEREAVKRAWIERFGRDGRLLAHHSPGCEHCSHTGHKGRAGVHELLVVSRELRRMIQTGARAEELQHTALIEGMHTLRQDGIEKVLQGIASIEEVRATSNV